jgi:hypothetical protein
MEEKFTDRLFVLDKETNRKGIVCWGANVPSFDMSDSSNLIPVIFEGVEYIERKEPKEIEIMFTENAIPEEDGCGIGLGKKCCIYACLGVDGLSCERFGPLRLKLELENMEAERRPKEFFPKCFLTIFYFKINLLSEENFSFNINLTPLESGVVGDGEFIKILAKDVAEAISEVENCYEGKTFFQLDEILDHELIYDPVG